MIEIRSHANLTTVALALVLLVMFTALRLGSGPALWISTLGAVGFNYFFVPPIHSLTIARTENWVAFIALVVTALVVGQLSSRARNRAQQAEAQKLQIEGLYKQLEKAFEEASEAESLRRSERLKTALLDAVTHDLRTPLTSIKASVTTMLGELGGDHGTGLGTEGQQELLEIINEETDRLNQFIESMVELAQIEAGHLLIRRGPVSAEEIIDSALERAASILQHHAIEITIQRSLPALLVDAKLISQAIFTILENAAKYSPPHSRIRMIASPAADSMVEISIQDEGPGIPASLRDRVFEKFYRGPEQENRTAGFGMGLPIARGIVEAHGGKIWIEPAPGRRGTQVCITLPMESNWEKREAKQTQDTGS
jgi:two-component system sensor histidine kinase KdpD